MRPRGRAPVGLPAFYLFAIGSPQAGLDGYVRRARFATEG